MPVLQALIQDARTADSSRQVQKEAEMLTIYRRHVRTCEHKHEGRKYRRCRCPIWVDGSLRGDEMRESLNLQNWEKAQERIRDWEVNGRSVATNAEMEPDTATTLDKVCASYIADAESRGLQESTLRKY